MLHRKVIFLIIVSLLLGGLLAACGTDTTPAVNSSSAGSVRAQAPSTTMAITQTRSGGAVKSATSANAPLPSAAPGECPVFSREDYATLFGVISSEVSVEADEVSIVCQYKSAEKKSGYLSLNITSWKRSYSRQEFESDLKVADKLGGVQEVEGVGDGAFQIKTDPLSLYLWKGQNRFDLGISSSLYLSDSDKLNKLKAIAQKVINHL